MKATTFTGPHQKAGAITSSWDDGVITDRRLIDFFNERQWKATWALSSGLLGTKSYWNRTGKVMEYVAADEIRALYAGHEVASHSKTHPRLDSLPVEHALAEIREDQLALEALFQNPIRGFIFPFGRGSITSSVLETLPSYGIEYTRSSPRVDFLPPSDFLAWHVACHFTDLPKIWPLFEASTLPHKILHYWGHSWELDENDGWNRFDSFWNSVPHSKFWFASNIEVVDWIKREKEILPANAIPPA